MDEDKLHIILTLLLMDKDVDAAIEAIQALHKPEVAGIKIGSVVCSRFDDVGTVINIYSSFYDFVSKVRFCTMTADQWIKEQLIPITEDQKRERWMEVELHNGGVHICFESSFKLI